jgi:endonuclease IV
MPRIGAHMSVSGGLPRAVERAVAHRCDALQIFRKHASYLLNLASASVPLRRHSMDAMGDELDRARRSGCSASRSIRVATRRAAKARASRLSR